MPNNIKEITNFLARSDNGQQYAKLLKKFKRERDSNKKWR
jgi:hypothetical protein